MEPSTTAVTTAQRTTTTMTTRRKIGGSNSNIFSLFIGMLLGASLMFLYSGSPPGPKPGDSHFQKALSDSARSLRQSLVVDSDGWHPIHVFYGEKSGVLEGAEDPNANWFSQVHQDEIVIDILGDGGYFIDLAANDAREFSNTLALERHGWNGLCIEPNSKYWYGLSHRNCAVVGVLVGSKKEQVDVKFRGVFGGIVGLMDIKMANRKLEPRARTEKRYTAPLMDVLQRFKVPKQVDYMSLDVEGAEYLIMKDFPFDKYQIKLMTVERPNDELKHLLEEKGFVYLKDLAWWGETLWAHQSTGLTPEHPKVAKIITVPR